ncbi:hypothetical protein BCR44DRAFT_46252 [Catenaria anguillulae PL171]|uniref:Uncharacterized protein n=1 Tax=Catenaria anguillulae PL171 TaxID=765915 RepID=A0A1Y2HDD6_9FUNG|nr:hypothetical protein BCR44DRAFT_46252 [Catenaria anguillulae PL171]
MDYVWLLLGGSGEWVKQHGFGELKWWLVLIGWLFYFPATLVWARSILTAARIYDSILARPGDSPA